MSDTPAYSLLSDYFSSFSSRPARYRTGLFWGWTVLLLSLLAFGSSAFAQATLTPATLSFGNQGLNDTSAAKTATFKNEQASPLTITSIVISGGTAPADYAWGGNCRLTPSTLGAGKSCGIKVTFTPSALGSRTATLTVTDTATNSPQTVSLTGTGVQPATTSVATLAFGNQSVSSTSAAKTVKLWNNASTAITLSGNTLTGTNASAFAVSATTCGASLAGHTSCTISVTFTPAATGAMTATLSMADSASNSPQTVSLTGTGVQPVSLSLSSLNFFTVLLGTTSAAKSVTLTNYQNVALAFSSILTTGDFVISSNTCDASLKAGAKCTVGVTFSPTATGARTGALTFSDNAATSPQAVSLTGTGSAPVTVSPTGLAFISTTVGATSAAKVVTLTNHLKTSLTLSTPAATGDFAVASNTCGGSVGAGLTCTIGVTFTPTEVGSRKGDLTIPTSAYGGPSVVPLSGTGNATGLASITVTPVNPSILMGQMQQFTATGTFKSGSTQNLTDSVTWSSSASGVATINAAGLASAVGQGPTTIEAALGSINGSTTLNVPRDSFVYTGSLKTARVEHTATLLNNGMVLMAGGYNDSGSSYYLAGAELYNPATGTFAYTAGSLNTARRGHTATLLNNGMVLMAGGCCDSSGDLASAELYNPATGSFSYTTGSLNTARFDHTATLLNNGMVLIAGGYNHNLGSSLASAELYNPLTETFTPTGSLNTARFDHTATLLNNGMVLMAGGGGSSGDLASAELYNPATGTFAYTTGSLNTTRVWHTATLLNNGLVLIAGGYNDFSDSLAGAELYDPATETFTDSTGSLNTAHYYHTATLLNNGMVLIAGGVNFRIYLAGAELYNPATGTFSYTTDSMNIARERHTATLLNNGMVLLAGGYSTSADIVASAELYGPPTLTPPDLESIAIIPTTPTLSPGTTQQFIATGTFSDGSTEQLASVTWMSSNTTLAQINNDAGNHGLSLAIPPGPATSTAVTITATAGSVSGTAALTVRPTGFVYTGSLNTGRGLHTATLLSNGMVLIAGGIHASSPHSPAIASAELYNPATGTFAPTGSLHTARYFHTATLLNNGMVLIAGGYNTSSGYLASAELYNPATGTFSLAGSLNTARGQHTATLLNNGAVLIAGGYGDGSSGYVARAELYNPATGTFSYTTGSLNTARWLHTATLLNDGMVLMAGAPAPAVS